MNALADVSSSGDSRARVHVPWAWHRYRYALLAYGLVAILLILDVILTRDFFSSGTLTPLIAGAAPIVVLTIASAIPVVAGGGGIDLSLGPLLGLINVILIIGVLHGHFGDGPEVLIPVALGLGALSGLVNGMLVTVVRIQPVVATLGTYLIYTALAATIYGGNPGAAPHWLASLADTVGPVPGGLIPVAAVLLAWIAITRTPYYRALYAVGDNEAAAFSSGVPVVAVKTAAYVIAGVFTGVAALAMTALIASADATVGPPLTLTAIAGVALGGTSLAGGRGGVLGALGGGVAVYLTENTLTVAGVSSYYTTFTYGAILVAGIIINGLVTGAVALPGIRR